MKKIFILLFSLGSLTSVFAQSNRDHDHDMTNRGGGYSQSGNQRDNRTATPAPVYDNRSNGGYDSRNNGGGYNNGGYDSRNGGYDNRNARDNRGNDWKRQQEIDRVNRDYNSRIDAYRRDRSLSSYERNRRISQMEHERDSKVKSFAGGLILGGVLGVLLGH